MIVRDVLEGCIIYGLQGICDNIVMWTSVGGRKTENKRDQKTMWGMVLLGWSFKLNDNKYQF